MADRVNAATERLLSPFNELKTTKICSVEENTHLFKKLTAYEYKIARNQRTINDYESYIQFFENFLALLDVRRKKLCFFESYKEIDAVFISKVFSLYEQAYFHFPHHLKFFDDALKACKQFNAMGRARRIWERYIELHASAKVYLSAAAYFYNSQFDDDSEKGNSVTSEIDARSFFQLGIRNLGSKFESIPLWTEWVRMELIEASKLRNRLETLINSQENEREGIEDLTGENIQEKALKAGLEPSEIGRINGMASILVNSAAVKSFQGTPVLAPYLSKVVRVLEEFSFMYETTELNYQTLASIQDSPYCWHAFAVKSLQSAKSSAEKECCKIYETGIARMEGDIEKEILSGLYMDTLKSFFEAILKLGGDKRRIRPKITLFLKSFEWLVVDHGVFCKDSFEMFKELKSDTVEVQFIEKLVELSNDIQVLLFCVKNGEKIVEKSPSNILRKKIEKLDPTTTNMNVIELVYRSYSKFSENLPFLSWAEGVASLIKFEKLSDSEKKCRKKFRSITSNGKYDERVLDLYTQALLGSSIDCDVEGDQVDSDADDLDEYFPDFKYSLVKAQKAVQFLKVCEIFKNEVAKVSQIHDQALRQLNPGEIKKFRVEFSKL